MGADRVRLEAQATGRVQGVGFRAFVSRQAQQLGCVGYVANSADGQAVVVVAEGERPALERLLAALGRGPRLARVTAVQAQWLVATGGFAEFAVRD